MRERAVRVPRDRPSRVPTLEGYVLAEVFTAPDSRGTPEGKVLTGPVDQHSGCQVHAWRTRRR